MNKALELPYSSTQTLATCEYHCIGMAVQTEPLVILHGWGSDSRIWQGALPTLTQYLNVITVDLPGFGDSDSLCPYTEEQVLAQLSVTLPGRCTLMGWSLGGMLATAFAARFPKRVNSLVTIAANACFTQRDGWPTAMPKATFDDFYRSFQEQPSACLKRFHGLQSQGDASAMPLLKQLRTKFQVRETEYLAWQKALQLLEALDNRPALQALKVPGLHLFANGDALVPVEAAEAIRALNHRQRTRVFEQTCHAMPVSCPDRLAATLLAFLEEARYSFGKERVAESFGRAAASYDSAAHLQRRVGQALLEKLPAELQPRCIVDIGCGTGYFTRQLKDKYPAARVIGLDLAEGMLQFARGNVAEVDQWLCGDAESLPLADNSVDLVFSSLAFQWCEQLPVLVKELERVLSDKGLLAFTSLCEGTLDELRSAWSSVDGYVHVNRFVKEDDWLTALSGNGLSSHQLVAEAEVTNYQEVRHLLNELKGIGAHNINSGQNPLMTGRQHLIAMIRAYESYRLGNGQLPATWQVLYGLALCEKK